MVCIQIGFRLKCLWQGCWGGFKEWGFQQECMSSLDSAFGRNGWRVFWHRVSLIGGSLLESQRLTTKDHSAGVLHFPGGSGQCEGPAGGRRARGGWGQGLSCQRGSDFGPLLPSHLRMSSIWEEGKKRKASYKFFTYFCSISCGQNPAAWGDRAYRLYS